MCRDLLEIISANVFWGLTVDTMDVVIAAKSVDVFVEAASHSGILLGLDRAGQIFSLVFVETYALIGSICSSV